MRIPRYSFVSLLLVAAIFLIGGRFLVDSEFNQRKSEILTSRKVTISITAERISGFLLEPAFLLNSLSQETPILGGLDDTDNRIDELKASLLALASRDPSYQQVRWIDENGRERVRIQRNGKDIHTVPDGQLQDKSARYYFNEVVGLEPGKIYISPLDLNVEQGQLEKPYRPTIRVAVSARDSSGARKGLFIIFRDAKEILDIVDLASQQGHFLLANHDGYWLKGFSPEEEWGFVFGKDYRVDSKSKNAWKAMSNKGYGHVELADGIWIWSTVHPFVNKEFPLHSLTGISNNLKLISYISAEELENIRHEIWKDFAPLIFISTLITWLLVLRLIHSQAARREAVLKLHRSEQLRKLESRAASAETESKLLIQSNVNGMLTVDKHGTISMTNPALDVLFGYNTGELIGKSVDILIPESLHARHKQHMEDYASRPKAQMMLGGRHVEGRMKNGQTIPVEVSLSPITAFNQLKVTATVINISDRILNERSFHLMKSIFENTTEAILVTDENAKIVDLNHAFTDITGYTREEVLGKDPSILRSDRHDAAFYKAMWDSLDRTGHWKGEIWNRKKDGTVYLDWLTLSCIKDDHGSITNYVSVFRGGVD